MKQTESSVLAITPGRPPFNANTTLTLSCGHTMSVTTSHEVGETVVCDKCRFDAFGEAELERERSAARRGGYTYVSGLGSVR